MLNTVTLKLINIKYSGKSIGNDICVEINALNNFLSVDKKIKVGKSLVCKDIVGQFFADGKFFSPEIKIAVIEKDLFFNDVGSLSVKLKIDLEKITPQINKYQVEVYEKRSTSGHSQKRAFFEVTLEININMVIGYAPETKDGWLVVLDEKLVEVSIPSFLRVQIEERKDGREYFVVIEGPLRGNIFSVKYVSDKSVFVFDNNVQTVPVRAVYSVSKKILKLLGKEYKATDYEGSPWVKGVYDIEISDFPHPGGLHYKDIAPRAKVWFRVGHDGERYIHTGSRSAGCITLIEKNRWDKVWGTLIKARKGDGVSVGTLEVLD